MSITGAFISGTINISGVTGDIVITASASAAVVASISAVYTQSGTVYNTDTLDSLREDLVVTATYDGGTTSVVTTYALSGALTAGTSTITVTYGGETTTFSVTVTHMDNSVYNWDFTTSLTDSKENITAVLGSDVTQDSNGLSFTSGSGGYVSLVSLASYASSKFTIEMDVTTLIPVTSDNDNRVINLTNSSTGGIGYGLNYRSSTWKINHTGTNYAPNEGALASNIFNGKTLKMQVDYPGKKRYLYADGVLVGTYTSVGTANSNGRNLLFLGCNQSSGSPRTGTVITGLRVYAGLV